MFNVQLFNVLHTVEHRLVWACAAEAVGLLTYKEINILQKTNI